MTWLLVFIVCSVKSSFLLNIYQQGYYENRPFIHYILRNILFINIPIIPLILFCYIPNLPHLFLCLFIIIGFGFFNFHRQIKHLVFTYRVLRIMTVSITLSLLLNLILPIYLIYFMFDWLLIFSNFLLTPYEKRIRKKFIIKAQEKVKASKAIKIAITGSYGKTSVKNYLRQMLCRKYLVAATPNSYNTPLGIAKFINEGEFCLYDYIIYEFGARRVNDISELIAIYNYDIAIVTEIGPMHLDTFKSVDNILKEKMQIVNKLTDAGIAILNYENELIRNYATDKRVISYGFNYGNYQAHNLALGLTETSFDLYVNKTFVSRYKTRLVGRQSVLNLLPAIILADLFKIDLKYLADIMPVENRLSFHDYGEYKVLLDAYNANLNGAIAALEVTSFYQGKRFIITPGFVEMHAINDSLIESFSTAINEACDVCILIKNDFTNLLHQKITVKKYLVNSFKEGFTLFKQLKVSDSLLLIENDLLDVYCGG